MPGIIKDGWYICSCGQKIIKVRDDTEIKNFVCYCRKCKKETIIDIIYFEVKEKLILSLSQRA